MTRLTDAWLTDERTQAVFAMFEAADKQIFVVGGCVRNALMGLPVSDVDMATDALPAETIELAERSGMRAVPTGIDHGTITLVLEGQPFEVTTFRRDVATFGRRAEVAFSGVLGEDASRRDFTMNALYADARGRVVDPLGGLADLLAGRVRFVGNAGRRIEEDYLRILRFFRFFAWYGNRDGGLDADGLAACAAGQEGLDGLSRERVGSEMCRLLDAPDPSMAAASMEASGILGRILPGASSRALGPLIMLEANLQAPSRWQRRLAALGWRVEWAELLRLSKADRKELGLIADAVARGEAPSVAAYRSGAAAAFDAELIRCASLGQHPREGLTQEIDRGSSAQFPIRASDLPFQGAELGAVLRRLEAEWIASDFALDKAELLRRLAP